MSQQNVEMARRAYDAYNRRDLEGMVVDFASSFEYVTTGAIPGRPAVYRGHDGWIEFAGWLWDEFDDARVDVHELTDAGDRVLAAVSLRGRGKQSGVETSWDIWHVWTVENGKVVHGQAFRTREEAVEAAGLQE
jgi:ketosteroid isomerase-like protein